MSHIRSELFVEGLDEVFLGETEPLLDAQCEPPDTDDPTGDPTIFLPVASVPPKR